MFVLSQSIKKKKKTNNFTMRFAMNKKTKGIMQILFQHILP